MSLDAIARALLLAGCAAGAGCASRLAARPLELPVAARAAYEEARRRLEAARALTGDEARAELEAAAAATRAARERAPGLFRLAILEQDIAIATDLKDAREHYYSGPPVTAPEKVLAARVLLPDRTDDALELLLAACEQDPQFAWARYGLAFVERVKGRTDDAIGDARRALELDPTLIEALRLLAELYSSAGERDRALEARRLLIEVTGGDLDERHRYARLLLEAEDKSDATDAEKELRVILASLGDPPAPEDRAFARDVLVDVGTAYARRRQFRQAIDYWNRALALDPDCLVALYNIGIVELQDREDPHAALAAFQEYLARAKTLSGPFPGDQLYYRLFFVPHTVAELQQQLRLPQPRARVPVEPYAYEPEPAEPPSEPEGDRANEDGEE